MPESLITIPEFIEEARKQGASLGNGDPKIHLAYLTKLGLLPKVTKRKINGQLVGCYPQSAIQTLLEIEHMKDQGVTLAQVKKSQALAPASSAPEVLTPLPANDFVIKVKPSNFAYLVLGLIIGVIVSTLNTSGLATINQTKNLSLTGSAQIQSQSASADDLYLIAVPKTSLDKLDKTNINYLIKN